MHVPGGGVSAADEITLHEPSEGLSSEMESKPVDQGGVRPPLRNEEDFDDLPFPPFSPLPCPVHLLGMLVEMNIVIQVEACALLTLFRVVGKVGSCVVGTRLMVVDVVHRQRISSILISVTTILHLSLLCWTIFVSMPF